MNLKTFFWLVVLALLWGPAFLFVKVAVQDIPPLTLVAARVTLAAALLYLVLRFQGTRLPKFGKIWFHFAVIGLTYNALPYVLLSWGQQYIDSALAGILIGTTPLFTILLAHFVLPDDHFTSPKVAGVFLGFAGLTILLGPALLGEVRVTVWGLLAVVTAAASYAAAIVYGRQTMRGLPPLVGPTAQLSLAALLLLPLAWLIERPYTLSLPSWPALGSLLGLTILSTALAFFLYYRIMEWTSATVLSMTAYLVPIVAVILGVLLLHESLTWNDYVGCGLILLGVIGVNGLLKPGIWRRLASAPARS